MRPIANQLLTVSIAIIFLLAACANSQRSELDGQFSLTNLTDEEVNELMDRLSVRGPSPDALQEIEDSGDPRFIAPLITVQRYLQRNPAAEIGLVLDNLTGQAFGSDWGDWVAWASRNDLPVSSGFAAWKADQLTFIDPAFSRFVYDDVPSTINLYEVVWGGVRVDGIPALDNPAQIEPADADYITPDELVFGLAINGDIRAYPLRIMDWHELFNDVVGGMPVSLAYCTLCGAGVLYDTTVDDTVYTFGSTGMLMRSNKLMYDRNTDSVWNQLTGQPVLGELVGTDIRLEVLPVTLTTWEDWLSDHPDTTVLDIDTGFPRDYTIGAAYASYFGSADTMFPVGITNDELATKDLIYALNIDDTPKAYPLDLLSEERVTNDALAGLDVVLVTSVAPELTSPEPGGAAVRAYQRDGHTFSPSPDGDDNSVVDENGETWTVSEEALTAPDGSTLERLPGHIAYWFGWYSFYPDTLLYEG